MNVFKHVLRLSRLMWLRWFPFMSCTQWPNKMAVFTPNLRPTWPISRSNWLPALFCNAILLFLLVEILKTMFLSASFQHGSKLWGHLREQQIRKMTHYGYENKHFLDSAVSFFAHMLYNLGVLAARIQGFSFEIRSNKAWMASSAGTARPDLVKPLLAMVYQMADVLLSDSIICLEPSQNPILVTNNLWITKKRIAAFIYFSYSIAVFPWKLSHFAAFPFFATFPCKLSRRRWPSKSSRKCAIAKCSTHHRQSESSWPNHEKISSNFSEHKRPLCLPWSRQLGWSETMQRHPKVTLMVSLKTIYLFVEGGNTAHKKSDVNSKEWISIPPLYDTDHGGWCATYPHLLCTTRQKVGFDLKREEKNI